VNKVVLIAVFVALAQATSANAQTVDPSMIERIARADSNGDGVVARAEFLTFRNSQFQRLDRNGDNYLSRADTPRLAGRALAGVDVASIVEQFDANNDSRVSREELASGPTPAFDLADQNQDQVVTQTERQAAVAAARR